LEAQDIVCCAGAEEAIYIAMQVLLSSDDHCIVITPNYQAAETAASVYRSDLGPVPADRFRIGFGRLGLSEGLAVTRDWLVRNAR